MYLITNFWGTQLSSIGIYLYYQIKKGQAKELVKKVVIMGYYRKWKPSKAKAREFAKTMDELRGFCNDNGIDYSLSMDSYYFTLNGKSYRVSNHTIESSNAAAYRDGVQVRGKYHDDKRADDVTYIHASKTRIRDIYNDLKAGYTLDGRGNRKAVQYEY